MDEDDNVGDTTVAAGEGRVLKIGGRSVGLTVKGDEDDGEARGIGRVPRINSRKRWRLPEEY